MKKNTWDKQELEMNLFHTIPISKQFMLYNKLMDELSYNR